jgi:hypothetical protein
MPRSMTLLCLSAVSLVVCTAAEQSAKEDAEEGFRPIFDGKTLENWDGNPKFWRVEDGTIVGQTTAENPTPGNTFLIWRGGRPADFVLRFEFRMPDEGFANSGVQYRSREEPKKWGRWVLGGYQADMADPSAPFTGMLYDEHGRGIVAKRGEKVTIGEDHHPRLTGKTGEFAELTAAIKEHQWNDYEIIAQGNHLQHKINGRLMVDVMDDDAQMRSMEGLIGLQIHAGKPMRVEFRNLRIKELPKATPSAPK